MPRSRKHPLTGARPAFKMRRGFALPIVILVIAVLTAAIAASLAASAAEFGTGSAQRGQARAFAVAQSGLELYMTSRDSLCALRAGGETCIEDIEKDVTLQLVRADSLRIKMTGGEVEIIAHQLRPQLADTLPATYFIRARGIDARNRVGGRDTTHSQRAVGVMATFNTTTVQVMGAWTSLSGIKKQGTAGMVSGFDQCGKQPPVAGIVVPQGDFQSSGHWNAEGNPPADSLSTLDQLEGRMKINWDAIINENALPADFEIPRDPFPDLSWFMADTTRWPVIRVHTNNYALPNQGRGIIIADWDFVISGSNMWDGIVLVGGQLISNGNNTTAGATISGLNMLLPGWPQPDPGIVNDDASLNGQKNYVYDSCKVARASKRMAKFSPLPNTWLDDVPTW
jgi:hypothetical protein